VVTKATPDVFELTFFVLQVGHVFKFTILYQLLLVMKHEFFYFPYFMPQISFFQPL
jgi:hypothetical protein